MQYGVYVLLCFLLAFMHFTRLSGTEAGPDVTIALLGWVCIAGRERWFLVHAWVLGACMDMIDPVGHSFYMLTYLFFAFICIPLRPWVSSHSYGAWFFWAFMCHIMLAYMSGGDVAYAPWSRICTDAFFTGILTVLCGLCAYSVPWRVHPLGGIDGA